VRERCESCGEYTPDALPANGFCAVCKPRPGWMDAGFAAFYARERFSEARTPVLASSALVELANAMSDLASWLPGYDVETGTIMEEES
jgi:hypothetical protein